MNEMQAEKKRRKLLDELVECGMEWERHYRITNDPKLNEKFRKHRDIMTQRRDRIHEELFALDRLFPPKYDYSKDRKYCNSLFVPVPMKYRAEEQPAATAPARQPANTTPAYTSSTRASYVTHSPAASGSTRSVRSGPHIPAGNYFASHEQLVSKIARTAAQRCAKWVRNQGKWQPVNNGFSSEYAVDITVSREGVEFNKLAYEGLNSIWFQSLGMEKMPEAKTEAFLHALKPFIDVYFPEEIEKAFSDVSPLIKRTTSVTFGEHHEGWDFDGRSYSKKCIHVTMQYTNPPAPKLKSW